MGYFWYKVRGFQLVAYILMPQIRSYKVRIATQLLSLSP